MQLHFTRPVLQWSEVTGRFFEMIYGLLGERLNVQTSEFSMNPANTLSEVRAKFSIYGGATSVSLLADRIAFDFPGLTSSDLGIVHEIMGAVHDGFKNYFPEVEQGKAEIQDFAHLDLGTQEQVARCLRRFQIDGVGEAFAPDMAVVNTPAVKFTVVSEDANWQSVVLAEQSALSTSAIFASAQISLRKLSARQSYVEKAIFVQDITKRCLDSLGLENENAPA